jgi:hypothetical protein
MQFDDLLLIKLDNDSPLSFSIVEDDYEFVATFYLDCQI